MSAIIFDLDDTIFDSSGRDKSEGDLAKIKPFDGVHEIIPKIQNKKILVTSGEEKYQNQKIDVLNIRHLFDEIHICPKYEDKLNVFRQIVNNLDPRKVIVIGDKINCEIRYAKMLGLKTVQLKHGRHANLEPVDEFEIPDHVIHKFDQIKDIIS